MFPKLREQLSDDNLIELGEQLAADKAGEVVIDLTKDELMEQAQAADIEGRSTMDKQQLEKSLGHR